MVRNGEKFSQAPREKAILFSLSLCQTEEASFDHSGFISWRDVAVSKIKGREGKGKVD